MADRNAALNVTAEIYRSLSKESVELSAVLGAASFFIILLAFNLLLCSPRARQFLAPRLDERPIFWWGWALLGWRWHKKLYPDEEDAPGSGSGYGADREVNEPPRRDDLDSVMMIRFCRMGFRYCLIGFIPAIFLSIWYTFMAHDNERCGTQIESYDCFTISTIGKDRPFWPSTVVAYFMFIVFMRLACVEWNLFIKMRGLHFCQLASGVFSVSAAQAKRSLIVERVPEGESVAAFFVDLFGEDSVYGCWLQPDNQHEYYHPGALVRKSISKGVSACRSRACPEYDGDDEEDEDTTLMHDIRRSHIGASSAARDLPPDVQGLASIKQPWHTGHAAQHAARSRCIVIDCTPERSRSSTAFVTFNRVKDCTAATYLLLSHKLSAGKRMWQTWAAPESKSIIWGNAAVSLGQLHTRRNVIRISVIVGILFWAVPVGIIRYWTNPESWQHVQLVEQFRLNHPTAFLFVTKNLPVLALLLLIWLLPRLFESIAIFFEGYKSLGQVHSVAFGRNLVYQMVTLFVTVFAVDVMKWVDEVINRPEVIFDLLKDNVPQVAVYFVTFVLTRGGLTLPWMLIHPLICPICATDADDATIQYCYFPSEAVYAALVMVLAMTYSVIAPAVLLACLIYFALAIEVYRWLFLYVYTAQFDMEGAMWYYLFNCCIVGSIIGTMTLGGLAIAHSDGFNSDFLFLVFLLALQCAFFCYCHFVYVTPSKVIAFEDIVKADRETPDWVLTSFTDDYYLDPKVREDLYGTVEGGSDSDRDWGTEVEQSSDSSSCSSDFGNDDGEDGRGGDARKL